jgi:hypothetical protein
MRRPITEAVNERSNGPEPSEDGGRRPSNTKVGRVIDEYGLEGMGKRLETEWTADGDESRSLRELADVFNRAVLTAAMEDAGMRALDGEVDNLYRLLSDDDVSAGARTEAESRLERGGVDVDGLRSDFVSHQAIHTYLTKYREVEYERDRPDPERSMTKLRRLQNRTRAVSEDTLDRLRGVDAIALDEYDVFVGVQVLCYECGRQTGIDDLLEAGGCECQL